MPLVLTDDKRQKVKSIIKEFEEHIAAIVAAPVFINISLIKATVEEDFIRELVCRQFNVEWGELIRKNRKFELVAARACYTYLCRNYLGITYKEIGQNLGGQDHTTAMSLYKNAVHYLSINDPLISNNLNPLINQLDEVVRAKNKEHALEI